MKGGPRRQEPRRDNRAARVEDAQRWQKIRDEYKETLDIHDYPGQVSLIFELDTRVMVLTGKGETIIGELASFDSYGNLILEKAKGRTITDAGVSDLLYGTCYIRLSDVTLIGRIDSEKEEEMYIKMKEKITAE